MPSHSKHEMNFKWNGQREDLETFKRHLTNDAARANCHELLEGRLKAPTDLPEVQVDESSTVEAIAYARCYKQATLKPTP